MPRQRKEKTAETKVYLIWDADKISPPSVIEAYSKGQCVEYYLASHGLFGYENPIKILELGEANSICLISEVSDCIPYSEAESLNDHHVWEDIEDLD